MDEIYKYNYKRWNDLVEEKALFTRPWLDLNVSKALKHLESSKFINNINDVKDKKILCLAAGGGQQSVVFSLLGAQVSVFDISQGQLDKDKEAATHYSLEIDTFQGDMRDLTIFKKDMFDIVWHPYSLNFVPDCKIVFKEVSRVLRSGGIYHVMAANPFAAGMGTHNWNGEGYLIKKPYKSGEKIIYHDETWVYPNGKPKKNIQGPQEFRQTLQALVNGLVENNLMILQLEETDLGDENASPGSWEHFKSFIPPWLQFWCRYMPNNNQE